MAVCNCGCVDNYVNMMLVNSQNTKQKDFNVKKQRFMFLKNNNSSKLSENWYLEIQITREIKLCSLNTPKFIAVLKEEEEKIFYDMLLKFQWGWKFTSEGMKNALAPV